jgi:hypothetical protein
MIRVWIIESGAPLYAHPIRLHPGTREQVRSAWRGISRKGCGTAWPDLAAAASLRFARRRVAARVPTRRLDSGRAAWLVFRHKSQPLCGRPAS